MSCFLWFHDWGKWQDGKGFYSTLFTNRETIEAIQVRECNVCGLRKVRKTK